MLNLQATRRIDEWYSENGVFGVVKDDINMRKKSLTTGEYIFEVEELEVGDVRLRFVDKKGNELQVCSGGHYDRSEVLMSMYTIHHIRGHARHLAASPAYAPCPVGLGHVQGSGPVSFRDAQSRSC